MAKSNRNNNEEENLNVNESENQKSNFELRKEIEEFKNSKEGRKSLVKLFESRKQIIEEFKNSNKQ
jgi:hypothetical protein